MASAREGSLASRLYVYREALGALNGIEFFTGKGYKQVILEVSSFPLGSHSTYLGSVVKAGLLGFSFLLLGWVSIVAATSRRLLQLTNLKEMALLGTLFVVVLTSLLWQLVEDIDAPPLGAMLLFVTLGLTIGRTWK